MKQENTLILLTRPKAQSQRFAAQITTALPSAPRILIAPLMEIAPYEWPRAAIDADYLIFTSQNAIQVPSGPTGQAAYCVGPRTTKLAQDMGYSVLAQSPTVAALIKRLSSDRPNGRGLYLRGAKISHDLINAAALSGLSLQEHVVYAQTDKAWSPATTTRIASTPDLIVPLFSARSAARFANAVQGRSAGVRCIGLSDAVIAALPLVLKDRSITSAEPTAFHMVQEIHALFAA